MRTIGSITAALVAVTFLLAGAARAAPVEPPGGSATSDGADDRVALGSDAGDAFLDRMDARLDASAGSSGAIPSFARKYGVTCALCHAPFPRLTEFGEQFAGNGFQMQTGEQPSDTVETGDDGLRLLDAIPLALRMDLYAQGNTGTGRGVTETDLQTPYNIKLLSGGQISDGISYYMYFFLSERGEVAGLEDAYVQFTDIGGSGVGVVVGQFQVSDPLFMRELRLEFEDYQVYRVNVGHSPFDLTYDRGAMVSYSPWAGGDLVAGVVNGRGLNESSATRQLDRDAGKNGFLRYSQGVGPVRVGGYVYRGTETVERTDNDAWVFGPDATVPLGSFGEVNLQYLRREDDDPFFGQPEAPAGDPSTSVDAAMGEVIWWPNGSGGDLHLTGLVNWVDADRPVISLGVGEQDEDPEFLDAYTSASLGASWSARRNVRVVGEAQWDFELDQARLTAGLIAAF